MIYQLRYSPIAEDDLDRVWDEVWEASQNFDIADKYVEDLRNALRQKKNAIISLKIQENGSRARHYSRVAFSVYLIQLLIYSKRFLIFLIKFSISHWLKLVGCAPLITEPFKTLLDNALKFEFVFLLYCNIKAVPFSASSSRSLKL